jgi:hypothetical protein
MCYRICSYRHRLRDDKLTSVICAVRLIVSHRLNANVPAHRNTKPVRTNNIALPWNYSVFPRAPIFPRTITDGESGSGWKFSLSIHGIPKTVERSVVKKSLAWLNGPEVAKSLVTQPRQRSFQYRLTSITPLFADQPQLCVTRKRTVLILHLSLNRICIHP